MALSAQLFDIVSLHRRLRSRACRLGVPPCDAEDLAQETLLRLLLRHHREPVNAPERYAMIILHNLVRARWRASIKLDPLEETDSTVLPVANSSLALVQLRRAIKALPTPQAQVMELILQGETSPRAIAQALALPQGTVMSRLARARATLRAQMQLETDAPVSELF